MGEEFLIKPDLTGKGTNARRFNSLTEVWSGKGCLSVSLLFKRQPSFLSTIKIPFSVWMLLFIKDQLNHLLEVGIKGHLLDAASSQTFNEDSCYENKRKTKTNS